MSVQRKIYDDLLRTLKRIDGTENFVHKPDVVQGHDITIEDASGFSIGLGLFLQDKTAEPTGGRVGGTIEARTTFNFLVRGFVEGPAEKAGGMIVDLLNDVEVAIMLDRKRGTKGDASCPAVDTGAPSASFIGPLPSAEGAYASFLAIVPVSYTAIVGQ